jgi:hypothetical protein
MLAPTMRILLTRPLRANWAWFRESNVAEAQAVQWRLQKLRRYR